MPLNPWIRLYREALHDPKIVTLSDRQHRAWHNCLLIADDTGYLPAMRDIAVHLRMSAQDAEQLIAELIDAELIDPAVVNGVRTYRLHGWEKRQYTSDSSAGRMQRYRSKRRASGLPILGDYSKFKPVLIERDGPLCVYCSSSEKIVVDHMVPIALGGTDDLDNLALACKACNAGKAGRTPELAGLKIISPSAAAALLRYRAQSVTVTVTPPDTDTEGVSINNNPSTVDRAREAGIDKSDFGGVSVDARRKVAVLLGVGNPDPIVAAYAAWPKRGRIRDLDAHFVASAATIFERMPKAQRMACQPLASVPGDPLPPVKASPQLRAKLKGKSR